MNNCGGPILNHGGMYIQGSNMMPPQMHPGNMPPVGMADVPPPVSSSSQVKSTYFILMRFLYAKVCHNHKFLCSISFKVHANPLVNIKTANPQLRLNIFWPPIVLECWHWKHWPGEYMMTDLRQSLPEILHMERM